MLNENENHYENENERVFNKAFLVTKKNFLNFKKFVETISVKIPLFYIV